MNSTLEILTPPTEIHEPASATAPGSAPQAENSAPSGTPHSEHRSRGKIACLPKKVRDHLNQMLEDGVRYAEIKEKLGEHGKDLTPDNISQWKKRGHQAWLKEQFWREEMRARMDAFTDLLGDTDPAQLPMVGLQMSLTQLCEQLRDIGPGARKDQFEADADKYLRMLNTLSRLSKSFLALQKFQRDSAAAAAVELKRLDPNRKINDVENNAMHDRADDFFGWKSAARIRRELANSASTASIPSATPFPSTAPAQNPASSIEPPVPLPLTGLPTHSLTTPPLAPIPVGPLPPAGELATASPARTPAPIHDSNIPSLQPPAAPVPEELCYECGGILPPLLPNGQRPSHVCPGCGVRLYPSGTAFDHCSYCDAAQPLLPNNERPSPTCRRCGVLLPPPGQRFVTHCPACHVELPVVTALGTRITDRCAECRATLPLLEPVEARHDPEAPGAEPPDLAA